MSDAAPRSPLSSTPKRERLARWTMGLVVIAMAIFVSLRFQLSTDITDLLPSAEDQHLARLARQLANSELSRTLILSVGGESAKLARTAARDMAATLSQDPEVAWLQRGPTPELSQTFFSSYFPHRLGMLSARPELELPPRLSDRGLSKAAEELKRQLTLPTAALVKRVAPADPLLSFPSLLQRLEASRPRGLQVIDGQFMSRDGERAILFLGTRHSAMSFEDQAPFLVRIQDALQATGARHSGTISLIKSGVHRHAVAARRRIEADVRRISVVSTIGIVLLFGLLFRSLWLLLLGTLPLAVGMLSGLAVTLLSSGRIHGLTLTFGATLIGVCLDYPVHLFNHYQLAAGQDEEKEEESAALRTLRRIWPGLLLGAVTTVTGFAGLSLSSLPAVREVALFAIAGIVAALLATRLLVVPLLPQKPRRIEVQQRAARGLSHALERLQLHRRSLWALPVVAVIVATVGIPTVRWSDDVKALTQQDPALTAEDEAIHAQVSALESGRVVVVTGATMEEALRANDRVSLHLKKAQKAGVLDAFRSLHSLLWSADLQRRNLAALQASPRLIERFDRALTEAGFHARLFSPFREALTHPAPPLTWPKLADSSLAPLIRPFRIEIDGEVGLLTFVRGVHDPKALSAAVAETSGAVFFDQRAFMNEAFGNHRQDALLLVLFGLLAVFAVVALRYRDLARTVLAVIPALLAGAFTLGTLALLGESLNLLHLISLVLVLSMGVDYGVFLAESAQHPTGQGATLLSIVIACASTVLAFGLLGMSSNPALHAIGLTTGIGVWASLILAPTVSLLARIKAPAAPSLPPPPEAP